ncbi:reverse transcriptase-like protein [Plakobranchus ocellatus]|uniref:Reverse transcriptase-like protein n=1 Tax=Plakobranchus ocellatus TaxID=259542 RepID=A0AAV3ZFV0_9GAST|nr:reverse transcriptase-like protein [Plakobranchus ocellatus]
MASSCMVYNAVICLFFCVAVCSLDACSRSSDKDCIWKGNPITRLKHGRRYWVYTSTTCHFVDCWNARIKYLFSGCLLRYSRFKCFALWNELPQYDMKCVRGGRMFIVAEPKMSVLKIGCQGRNDDSQIYIDGTIEDLPNLISNIQNCIEDINTWMANTKLKLNEEKTEIILLGYPRFANDLQNVTINLSGHEITCKQTVKNLGVNIDQSSSMMAFGGSLCKSLNFQLRRIGLAMRIEHIPVPLLEAQVDMRWINAYNPCAVKMISDFRTPIRPPAEPGIRNSWAPADLRWSVASHYPIRPFS